MRSLWRRLGQCVFAACLALPGSAAAEPPASLFAHVMTPPGHTQAQIPFPLGALLAQIRPLLESDGPDPMPLVLIPLGRSLQRHTAGAAHYFEAPRVVVAVTGEPAGTDRPLLRDRLYIGYHEAAGVLEVISYNEGAGRFDFEIVDDYRAGATPRLRAGNRGLCLACHQNAAPIFSRQSWDETSANPAIRRLLAAAGGDFYGLPWRHGVDVANAIDDATDRANRLSLAQTVWQHGCASAEPSAAVNCRARLLSRALLARLSGTAAPGLLADDPALAPLAAHWAQHWPEGLPLPDPDIPNRQPFAATLPWQALPTDPAALRRLADVAERFDPLALRAPLEHWRGDDPATLSHVVHAVGQFFADADIAALDQRLRTAPTPSTETLTLACTRRTRPGREDLDCHHASGIALSARRTDTRLWLDQLSLGSGRAHAGLRFERAASGRFVPSGPAPRTAEGAALVAVAITPDSVSLQLADDLAPLRAHIERLAADTLAGRSDALADAPLRRATVLAALLPMPPERTQPVVPRIAERSGVDDPELAPFYRHCGLCHNSTEAFPPGFLHGDRDTVRARIDTCAPRMARRLAMWAAPAGAREKTPMPPPASSQAGDIRHSGDLASMQQWLATRLQASGHAPSRLAAQPYADLPDCAVF
ncbi:hypothetical protein [Denitromonas iodatirespirans]|uniref:Cytochrome c domain-containing protein n=1 Tax=Denitromonas iodatirespirans TaxID=2795389 RepID=A0A944DEV4_DENI1|nr:hypothetical protein [Denitromonas iodatirespirans]MBT0963706.1 hypothetical protein [Denitromonas iodatirespirans]